MTRLTKFRARIDRRVLVLSAIGLSLVLVASWAAFAGGESPALRQERRSGGDFPWLALPATPENGLPPSESTTSTVVAPGQQTGTTAPISAGGDSGGGGGGGVTTVTPTNIAVPPIATNERGIPVVTLPAGGWQEQTGAGLSLTITPSSNEVDPATFVTFAALVVDSGGGLKQLSWDFGDGATATSDIRACNESVNRPTVQDGQTNFPAQATHAYRAPGRYTVRATAVTGARCGSRAGEEEVTATGFVTVRNGRLTSNGPSFPTVRSATGAATMPEDPHAEIVLTMGDQDGYISEVVVDWYDPEPGVAQTKRMIDFSRCTETPNRWPASLETLTLDHTYVNPGTHNIAVTVTSTGCDGQAPQTASDFIQVTTGGTASAATLPGAPALVTPMPAIPG